MANLQVPVVNRLGAELAELAGDSHQRNPPPAWEAKLRFLVRYLREHATPSQSR